MAQVKAFTLLELMIVVIIIGLLASIGLVQYKGVVEKARSAEAYAVLSDIVKAEKAYYIEHNGYTSTWSDLDTFDREPHSDNFDFSIANVGSGYVEATREIAETGRNSYRMCLENSKKISCPAGTCSETCP